MICREVLPILSEYVDGELHAKEVALVEEHLAHCSSCAKVVGQLKQLTSVLSSTREIEPPSFLLAQIEDATINRRSVGDKVRQTLDRVRYTTPRYARLTAAMATGVLLVGMLVSQSQLRHTPQVSTVAERPHIHSTTKSLSTLTGSSTEAAERSSVPIPSSGIVVASSQDTPAVSVHHRHRGIVGRRQARNLQQLVASNHGQESVAPLYATKSTQSWSESEMPATAVSPESTVDTTGDTVARADTSGGDKIITVASAGRSLNLQEDPSELQRLRRKLQNKYRDIENERQMTGGVKIPIGVASIRF